MILNAAKMKVNPDKRTEFYQTIGELLERISHAQGCLGFQFYVDPNDEDSSLLIGEWESEADLENHLRSNDFAILRGAITLLCSRRDEVRALVYVGDKQHVPARLGMTSISPT
jgi:quinol monooxygenase YgiN